MNALLICNVGTRDVTCAALPKDQFTGERQWAQAALSRYTELRAEFALPIIGKALHYLADRQIALARVILIASDQPASVAGHFSLSDTVHSATLIARLLADGLAPYPPIAPDRIETWIIQDEHGRGGDPSDYDLALRFCERRLLALAQACPAHTAFLQVSGGTPAMTTALLIAGTEAFGGRTEVLAIPPHTAPIALTTGRRLLAARSARPSSLTLRPTPTLLPSEPCSNKRRSSPTGSIRRRPNCSHRCCRMPTTASTSISPARAGRLIKPAQPGRGKPSSTNCARK